jgi:hypothetical protein
MLSLDNEPGTSHLVSLLIFILCQTRQQYFGKSSYFTPSFSSFPLGSFTLCFRKHLILMAYCTIPRIGQSNFLHQFRAATPPN